jgi:hypothetical protein
MAPSSTSKNPNNSFKLAKASNDVNEFGSFVVDLHPLMLKVDNIFKVFNVGRLSKEDIQSDLSSLSSKNNMMTDGRILIHSQSITEIFSRHTIDWMASGNVSNL